MAEGKGCRHVFFTLVELFLCLTTMSRLFRVLSRLSRPFQCVQGASSIFFRSCNGRLSIIFLAFLYRLLVEYFSGLLVTLASAFQVLVTPFNGWHGVFLGLVDNQALECFILWCGSVE